MSTHFGILLQVLGSAGFRVTVNGRVPPPGTTRFRRVGTALRRNLLGRALRRRLYDVNLFVDPDDLEAKIESESVMRMASEERAELGRRAREWFEENDRRFRARFVEVVRHAC